MDKTPGDESDSGLSTTDSLDKSTEDGTPDSPTNNCIGSNKSLQVNTKAPIVVALSSCASPPTPSFPGTPRGVPNNLSPGSSGFGSPGQNERLLELPEEFMKVGWRVCFSRREQRHYYYNKMSRESVWDLQALQMTQSFTDPLGIEKPEATFPSSQAAPGDKRKHTEEVINMSSPGKKLPANFVPFWNTNIPSNVMLYECTMSGLLPPHPEIELFRAQCLEKLRHSYQELCLKEEGIDAPKESFNRWLLERLTVDKGSDPVLPSVCSPSVSPAMFREIMEDIPVRLYKPKYTSEARRQLSKYAESAKNMIESSRDATSEGRKQVKWNTEDAFVWLRRHGNSSFDDYLERIAHLKRQCQPHLTVAAKSSVERICNKLQASSTEYAAKIHEKHTQLLAKQKILPVTAPAPPAKLNRKIPCYSTIMATQPCRMPNIIHKDEESFVYMIYEKDMHRINNAHLYKLELLYKHNCRDDPSFGHFVARVWCLIRRYQTIFGINKQEGLGQHAALPVTVFECLNRVFGVTFECFASPLNCYFRQFCSAFPDTDGYFGSRGSFLKFYPLTGSFECNPPFCEELMLSTVDHIESLLSESNEPLSFIVFVPEWRDPPTEALVRLDRSKFNRKQLVIPPHDHEYRSGYQHRCEGKELNLSASHGTSGTFLQNDAGNEKWKPTAERVNELKLAFRPQTLTQ